MEPTWLFVAKVAVIAIAAIGQTTFVALWARLPWYKEWIGRALMTKAVALMVFIDVALLWELIPGVWRWQFLVNIIIYLTVTAGIWLQVVALYRETRRAREGHRSVQGIEP